MSLTMGSLLQQLAVRAASEDARKLGTSTKRCNPLTPSNIRWMTANGAKYTPQEVGNKLGHKPNTIRAYARRAGIQLKQVRHHE